MLESSTKALRVEGSRPQDGSQDKYSITTVLDEALFSVPPLLFPSRMQAYGGLSLLRNCLFGSCAYLLLAFSEI